MKRIAVLTHLVALIMLTSACSSTPQKDDDAQGNDMQVQYTKLINEAETTYKEVDQMGGAWAYTEELIQEARTKASQNKYDEAIKLAKDAYDEAISAKTQFESQINAGPYLF